MPSHLTFRTFFFFGSARPTVDSRRHIHVLVCIYTHTTSPMKSPAFIRICECKDHVFEMTFHFAKHKNSFSKFFAICELCRKFIDFYSSIYFGLFLRFICYICVAVDSKHLFIIFRCIVIRLRAPRMAGQQFANRALNQINSSAFRPYAKCVNCVEPG